MNEVIVHFILSAKSSGLNIAPSLLAPTIPLFALFFCFNKHENLATRFCSFASLTQRLINDAGCRVGNKWQKSEALQL